jgi:hypothetical protein
LKRPKAPDLHLKRFRPLAERPPFGGHAELKVQTFLQSQKPPEKLTFTGIISTLEISRADYATVIKCRSMSSGNESVMDSQRTKSGIYFSSRERAGQFGLIRLSDFA